MELLTLISFCAVYLFSLLVLAYVVSMFTHNNGIMDVLWGVGFIVVTLASLIALPALSLQHIIVLIAVLLWGLRLSFRIGKRNWGKPEDFRYAKWRVEWGRWFFLRSLFQIYILQGVLLLFVALPIFVSFSAQPVKNISVFAIFAIVLWLCGYYFEVRGDLELDRFKSNPENKGKLLMTGLWSITRHPNYFGESLMWWSLALFVFLTTSDRMLGLIAFVSPVLITYLLLRVSGVPMVERAMEGNPDFPAYRARTSVFIPWLRRG